MDTHEHQILVGPQEVVAAEGAEAAKVVVAVDAAV